MALFLLALILTLRAATYADDELAATEAPQQKILKIAQDIHKAIVTLPQYGVFDSITYGIKGSTVILSGEASRPILKSSAAKIEGVSEVQNDIEVLPLSPNDDRIRAGVYAAIYRYPPLQKYTNNRGPRTGPSVARMAGGITNDPPIGWHAIHILVKNGNVTLNGVVDSDVDLALAEMRANSVFDVFTVQNDIEVATKGK